MERLTKRNEDDTAYYYPNCFKECDGLGYSSKCNKCDFTYEVCEKLGEYEDAEEQGLLLRLPCKVGDTVYLHMIVGVDKDKKTLIIKIVEAKVIKYVLDEITLCIWTETKDKVRNEVPLSAFGETVFLTQAEAKKKLKEFTEKDGH